MASLDDVVCPPYDVISESDRLALLARSPRTWSASSCRITTTRATATWARPALLDAWRREIPKGRDSGFYGYRMRFADPAGGPRQTLGVIGALELEPPGTGILPHEETTPKAKTDRLELLRATSANLFPIWGLAPVSGLSSRCTPPDRPAEHVTDLDRVSHEMWPIVDVDQIKAIQTLVESEPVVIADGHHRYETALTYRDKHRRLGTTRTDDDFVMALMVELADEQLTVQAIHRLIDGLPSDFDVPAALGPWFDVTPTAPTDRTITIRMAEAQAVAV